MRSIKILLMHHRTSDYVFGKVKVRFEGISDFGKFMASSCHQCVRAFAIKQSLPFGKGDAKFQVHQTKNGYINPSRFEKRLKTPDLL